MQDLIVLCADQDAKLGVEALLRRSQYLGFRAIGFDVIRHPNRDNGVFQGAHELLRSQCNRFSRAITICDFEGCGRERFLPREQIEARIEQRLQSNGWEGRAAAIVIQPELEAWVWGDWSSLAKGIAWPDGKDALRTWLEERGFIQSSAPKPDRPKESLARVLRQTNRSSSSSLFAALGSAADTTSCSDPAFRKLLVQLRHWFPL